MEHQVRLANGKCVPALGLGTWYLGDSQAAREKEIEALRSGIDAGMTLIDTAEMYGSGRSEKLVGEAIAPYDREKLFVVSKVLPGNAGRRNMVSSLNASLKRLGTDYLDLYLYHWRGSIPLSETVDCLEGLRREGRIKAWGVSNFDIDDMEELFHIPGGRNCQVNQVLYHTGSRGIEYSLLPWMRENGVALMSYCPLAQAGSLRKGLFSNPVLQEIAREHNCDVTQVLLSWNIRDGRTIAIPRSGSRAHTLLNAGADRITLTAEELDRIDRAYPAPRRKIYLDMQ